MKSPHKTRSIHLRWHGKAKDLAHAFDHSKRTTPEQGDCWSIQTEEE